MKKYIIIPGCSDLNRGDQALVWETKRIAEEAGYVGDYYLTSEKNEPVVQSQNKGIKIIPLVLEHPSRKFKDKENICYTRKLKLKWGFVAIFDLIQSLLLLWKPTRFLMKRCLDDSKRNSISIMEEADAVFMKGGGLLQTYGGLSSTYSMYFWVYPILLACSLKKTVYVMPNSFGPFEGPLVKNIARSALKKCKVLTSRETLSQEMVKKELGLNIENYPDLAFSLPKADLNRETIFEKYSLPRDRKLVAITMRPYRFPGSENPEKAYLKFKTEMAKFIEWLYEQKFMPVVVEHTLAVNAHENDSACIKDVIKMVESYKYRLVTDQAYDCCELKCIYSYCDYIIGTRFHSIIFSFGCDVPGIAIAYTGNKSHGIMHDIGLDDFVIDIGEVCVEKLVILFRLLLKNENEIIQQIKRYRMFSEKARIKLIDRCRYHPDPK